MRSTHAEHTHKQERTGRVDFEAVLVKEAIHPGVCLVQLVLLRVPRVVRQEWEENCALARFTTGPRHSEHRSFPLV